MRTDKKLERKNFQKLLLTIVGIVVFAFLFFQVVYSGYSEWLKAIFIILIFIVSSQSISRILELKPSSFLLLVKSTKGLTALENLGKSHPRLFTELVDLGLSISYGIPYSAYLFYKDKNKAKLPIHALISFVFYYSLLQFTPPFPFLNNLSMLAITCFFGLAGLALSSLITSSYSILIGKTAQSSVAPVIPGITIPLSEGIIALIFVAFVHEVAHGVLCAVEKIKVNSSGAILLGFLPIGAFVEPDEKKLSKSSVWSKRRVLIAGSTSNLIFFVILLPVALSIGYALPFISNGYSISSTYSLPINQTNLSGRLISINGTIITPQTDITRFFSPGGMLKVKTTNQTVILPSSFVIVSSVEPNSIAFKKLKVNDTVLTLNSTPIFSISDLQNSLSNYSNGAPILVGTQKGSFIVSKGNDGKIGIAVEQIPSFSASLIPKPGFSWLYQFLYFLYVSLGLASILSLAVAMVNILPLFFTDGHKLIQDEFSEVVNKSLSFKISMIFSLIVLLLIMINLSRWLGIF